MKKNVETVEQASGVTAGDLSSFYGRNVFSIKAMRDCLSEKTYDSLYATICQGKLLDPGIADEVADAMKTWAVSRGATHFTHWFQPLTGATAEKHDSFIVPDREGGAILQFSGKELIKGEPDASSFPSGGLRATFEARGYTAWDPTSPAFLKRSEKGTTLCIPTAFFGYHGEALDQKTPLLRSIEALSNAVCRLAGLFGIGSEGKRAYAELGAEQEYFLIDKALYRKRLDLVQTGRTLFGRRPAKHQQMGDHYFGAIKSRVLAFMEDLDRELWELGIPAKTRHNEVCPAQFEIASVYEELNLAVDHNMVLMQTMRELASRHGFACLLHEKPFAGVNGSGKHNNWNVVGPDGKNWLSPGTTPLDNAKFLTMICALIKAVDSRADILRASVATVGNDHRLGGHEAPPAILSVFLGEELTKVLDDIGQGATQSRQATEYLHVGVSSLPGLPKDDTDRNRTSPFAFTGNKFEFRAVGSSQSCAGPCMVLNTIVAEALVDICDGVEAGQAKGKDFNGALEATLREVVQAHKRVIFNGDNYTEKWHAEAERRGLPHVRATAEAIHAFRSERTIALFERFHVFSRRELESRYEVYRAEYEGLLCIEAECSATLARTRVCPVALEYQRTVAGALQAAGDMGLSSETAASAELLKKLCVQTNRMLTDIDALEAMLASGFCLELRDQTAKVRVSVDGLEALVPHDAWPLPTYADMMFIE